MSGRNRNVGFDPYKTAMNTPHGRVLSWLGFGKKAEKAKFTTTSKTQRDIERENIKRQAQKFPKKNESGFYDSDIGTDIYQRPAPKYATETKKPYVNTAKKFDDARP